MSLTVLSRRLCVPLFVAVGLFLSSCNSEIIRQQEEQIQLQQEEIMRQRKEIQEIQAAKQREEQKRQDCNRAFREYFDKVHKIREPAKAVALYREGLKLCPDDDVAHYELGKILREMGRTQEAVREFEAALKINPAFQDAKNQLEVIRKGP